MLRRPDSPSEASDSGREVHDFKVHCFRCGGSYKTRECRKPKPRLTCHRCEKEDHIASLCEREMGAVRLRVRSYPLEKLKALPGSLPVVKAMVGDREVRALVDSGCLITMLTANTVTKYEGKESRLVAVDGREIGCESEGNVEVHDSAKGSNDRQGYYSWKID